MTAIHSVGIKVDEDAAVTKRGLDSGTDIQDGVVDDSQARVKRAKKNVQQQHETPEDHDVTNGCPQQIQNGHGINAQQMPPPDLVVNPVLAQNGTHIHDKRAGKKKQASNSSQPEVRRSNRRKQASKHGLSAVAAAAQDAVDQSVQDAVDNGHSIREA